MISNKLHEALVKQMNEEFRSAHLYMDMAAYCTNTDYNGFAHFFIKQADEEREHAMKLYHFISEIDREVSITGIELTPGNYSSLLDATKSALEQEKAVTASINNLMDISIEEKAYAAKSFLQWFVDEQVEEESSFRDIIVLLERFKDSIVGLHQLDIQLGQRK